MQGQKLTKFQLTNYHVIKFRAHTASAASVFAFAFENKQIQISVSQPDFQVIAYGFFALHPKQWNLLVFQFSDSLADFFMGIFS